MNLKSHKTERIHSLDSLRAVLMLLGLILHSALTYNVTYHGDAWSIKDPNTTHIFSDFIVLFIHSIRMPIFFLLAGFFGAMLFYERQPMRMIRNRLIRIVFPLIVFLFFLWPVTTFTFSYTNAFFSQQESACNIAIKSYTNLSGFLPSTTLHLWFLYYLSLITGSTVVLALLLKKRQELTKRITQIFDWLIQRPLARIIFFSALIFITLTALGTSMIQTSTSLIPDFNTFIYFFEFYLIGWVLYKSKHHLDTLVRYDWICTILAIVLTIIKGFTIQNSNLDPDQNLAILILYSSVIVCLFMFGIIGLFIRYGSKYSTRVRYISDSSYWIYLMHLPLTAIIPAFIWDLPLSTFEKFMIVLATTTIICFVSYHYLVRNTFIGKFLNGRKYPKKTICQ